MKSEKICFIVMPFRPELHYFFLYVQKHLQEKHGLHVRRGDTSILTKALMEKIELEIQSADLIIGDVTHHNPNVFYELGIARANRKPIIFLTQDEPEKAPVDLRQFEFIKYDLAHDQDLLTKLDNAVRNALGEGYQKLHEQSLALLRTFNNETSSSYAPVAYDEFQARVMRGERLDGIPTGAALREFLLPRVIAEATDMAVIRKLDKWLSQGLADTRSNEPIRQKRAVPSARRRG